MTDVAVIMTTVADEPTAAKIGRALVEQRLAACVQRLPIASCYRWDGEVTEDTERLLLVKTANDRVDAAMAAIKRLHPYDLPEIVVLPAAGGLDAYLRWVTAQTRPEQP